MIRYSIRQLEYFLAVAEFGSIADAAEKINVSSPSISAAISELEADLGLQLMVRRRAQGVVLTKAGQRILLQAKTILEEANKMTEIAADLANTVKGPLSVGCLLTFAQVVFPSLRKAYETAYPEVQISQFELNQSEIFDKLRRSEIDIAITYDLDVPTDMEFIPLIDLPPYAVISGTHPLAKMSEVSIKELTDYPMVLLDLPHSSDYFLSLFAKSLKKVEVVERTKDMAVMRSMVANGYGFSIANMRILNASSPDGKPLEFIPIAGKVKTLFMGVLNLSSAKNSTLLQSFINHCTDQIKSKQLPGLEFSK